MNVIATIGEIGLNPEENDVSETLLNNQPINAKPAIDIITKRYVSFLLMI
jgi:hypothetical protein